MSLCLRLHLDTEVKVSAVSVLKSQRHSSATRESHEGRGFFHQRPILKKGSPDQISRCRTCAEASHSPFQRV